MLTENGGAVNFFINCSKLTDGFATVNNGGIIAKSEQITSINKINAVYTASAGASLQFKASIDKSNMYKSLQMLILLLTLIHITSIKAVGGSINIKSLKISFLCSPNPNVENVVLDSYYYSVSDFYTASETNFSKWRSFNLSKGYLVNY